MMQQYLRWSCGLNYGIVMPTLKWFTLLRSYFTRVNDFQLQSNFLMAVSSALSTH